MCVLHSKPGKGANAARALFVQRGRVTGRLIHPDDAELRYAADLPFSDLVRHYLLRELSPGDDMIAGFRHYHARHARLALCARSELHPIPIPLDLVEKGRAPASLQPTP